MSKRRDFPTTFAPVPKTAIKTEIAVILEQVLWSEGNGQAPIKEHAAYLVEQMDLYGRRVCRASMQDYDRWSTLAKLN